jgi:MFS family permease
MTTTQASGHAPEAMTGAKPGAKLRLLINRDYGLLLIGQTVSSVGDLVFITTLVVWIGVQLTAGRTWAPLTVSGVLVAAAAPVLLIGPLAGVFVDRWDKRRTMLAVNALQGLVILALMSALGLLPLPLLNLLGIGPLSLEQRLGAIYAAVFLVNACALFSLPAIVALIGDLVPEARQARANGVFQVSGSLATILGPAVAAALFFAFGPTWALVIDALSFVVALLTVRGVRAPPSARSVQRGARGHFLREFAGGVRFSLTNRVIATLLIGFAIAKLGFGALNALDVFFVTQNLHASPQLYGLTATALGVGTLIGAALAGALAERVGLARLMWLSLTGVGIAMVVWSRMTDFAPALGVLFGAGVLQGGLNVATIPLVLRVTPKEMIGRVIAVAQPTITLCSLIAMGLAGYLASTALAGFHVEVPGVSLLTFGPIDGIFAASGLLAALGGLYTGLRLRGVRLTILAAPDAETQAYTMDQTPMESVQRQ